MAQFISRLFRRWVWFCTNGAICWLGKMRFGVSTVFFTISCWCYFENFRRITYYCFLEKPRLQLQHRFRCAGVAQGIMMLKNKWFYFMMPLIGNEAVGCVTLSAQLQTASRAMLQIVLGVHWPQCLQNIEALGSWGDTQTQCQIFSCMCFLRPWSVSVTLSLFSRSKANGDWWGEPIAQTLLLKSVRILILPAMKSDVRHLMTQALTLEITLIFAEAFLRMFCSFSAYMIPMSISDGWMYREL